MLRLSHTRTADTDARRNGAEPRRGLIAPRWRTQEMHGAREKGSRGAAHRESEWEKYTQQTVRPSVGHTAPRKKAFA